MRRIPGLSIAILLLGYGLIRVGVGGALLAQSMERIDFAELADAVSEVREFMEARADRQIVPFSVPGYFVYILAMGIVLATGAVGAIARRRWGHASLAVYLALHAALFVNFREINPKMLGLVLQAVLLLALVYLRPARVRDHAVSP